MKLLANPWVYSPEFLGKTSLLIEKGRILHLGEFSDLKKQYPKAEVFDLSGYTLLPGAFDSHLHFFGFARSLSYYTFPPGLSYQELVSKLSYQDLPPEGEWILARGWSHSDQHPPAFPSSSLLDLHFPHHPVAFYSRDGHALWLNTQARKRLKLSQSSSPGAPQGVFLELEAEAISQKIQALLPTPPFEKAMEKLFQSGVTGFHTIENEKVLDYLLHLSFHPVPSSRVFFSVYTETPSLAKLAKWQDFPAHFLGLKAFSDGALGSQTAWMISPYRGSHRRGRKLLSLSFLKKLLHLSEKTRCPLLIHAIGDAATQWVAEKLPRSKEKHRMEHAQHLHPATIETMARKKVVASMQPAHLLGDAPWIRKYLPRRGKRAYPFQSLLQNKVPLIFGSDAPIESVSVTKGIYAAWMRDQYLEGTESLSLEEAIAAYTETPYKLLGKPLGRLSPGYMADFVVYKGNLSCISPSDWLSLSPVATFVAGQIVWKAQSFFLKKVAKSSSSI